MDFIPELARRFLEICEYYYSDIGEARALAHSESRLSNLPGGRNGPQDAYRHILIAAELTRRLGTETAKLGLDALEAYGTAMQLQKSEDEAMDRYNNELGYKIGQNAQSWKEVVARARELIERDHLGEPGYAWWESPVKWEDSPPESNWPNPKWPVNGAPFPLPPGIPYPLHGNWSWKTLKDLVCSDEPPPGLPPWDDAEKAPNPMWHDPLVLDLDGDGITTTSVTNGPWFDHDSNGFVERSGWISPYDGFLVMDRNGNGFIDDGKELFGNETILSNGIKAANGFEALDELDGNHGVLGDELFDRVLPRSRDDFGANVGQISWSVFMKSARLLVVAGFSLVVVLALLLWIEFEGRVPTLNEQLAKAAKRGDVKLVASLLERGVDPDAKLKDGETAVVLAVRHDRTDVVKLLLDKGADINIKGEKGRTLLMDAAGCGSVGMLNLLIDKGISVNARTEEGGTALMDACYHGNVRSVELLVDMGADVNAKTEKGLIPVRDSVWNLI